VPAGWRANEAVMSRRSNVKRAQTRFEPDNAGRALLMIVTPLLVGGAVVLAVTGASPLRTWLQGMFRSSRQRAMREASRQFASGLRSTALLRRAIVGSAKRGVVAVFGPPRTATVGRILGPAPTFWQADTWYYPIHEPTRSAMAIRFTGNVAAEVEFVTAPTGA
jgi:hypothetical protein